MDGPVWLLAGMVIAAAAVYASRSLGNKGKGEQEDGRAKGFPYQKRQRLLSPAERSFYGVLRTVADANEWDVFAKVRLEDLIEVQRDAERFQAYRSRIKSRHVDFVLCDQQTVSPLLAIELNDASHSSDARQERDTFVAGALNAAGIPLATVSAQRSYSVADLSKIVSEKLRKGSPALAAEQPADVDTPVEVGARARILCPRCGGELVERQSRQTGQRFLGCSNYPACRHTQPM